MAPFQFIAFSSLRVSYRCTQEENCFYRPPRVPSICHDAGHKRNKNQEKKTCWNASNGDFTSAVTKPTPPDTLAGSGDRATKSAAIKPEEKSQERVRASRTP
ncbi:hypothetical protein AVEN_188255-1 [Araneus ventricosus]|uniref:Uncharacterized protein n=1 Tax=Araneus ventricosus TaxID=182803 RepID=A0A4Y2HD44_ARAVE|nr:hypothetical protein AVEN_188255-1 [Araneus ventricosus]